MRGSTDTKSKNIDILMEYVPGGSLRFMLENFVRFKEKLIKSYTRQILEGLKSLHDEGIAQGDLKVSNLLIDDLGILKLSDFRFIKQVLYNTSKFSQVKSFISQEEDVKDDNFEAINSPL